MDGQKRNRLHCVVLGRKRTRRNNGVLLPPRPLAACSHELWRVRRLIGRQLRPPMNEKAGLSFDWLVGQNTTYNMNGRLCLTESLHPTQQSRFLFPSRSLQGICFWLEIFRYVFKSAANWNGVAGEVSFVNRGRPLASPGPLTVNGSDDSGREPSCGGQSEKFYYGCNQLPVLWTIL